MQCSSAMDHRFLAPTPSVALSRATLHHERVSDDHGTRHGRDQTGDRTRTLADRASRIAARERRMLVVVEDGGAGAEHVVQSGAAVVGRAEGADVRLSDPTVSQLHVELDATDAGVVVRDLGSHNGTRAGAIGVTNAVVPSGTKLFLGDATIEVRVGASTPIERSKASSFGGLVGASLAMREVYIRLERLAPSALGVLVEGETGTGKELAARAIHDSGPQKDGPFVVLRCSAIPPDMANAVFAGEGGVFRAAAGGTLLLDEIADLAAPLQAKLLGAMDRAGSALPRIVATTARHLRALVNSGAFREELYFRIARARIRLPSLAERPEDVKPLVQHFLSTLPWGVPAARAIESDAREAMAQRSYAGNVRELRSAVERAAALAEGPSITLADLAFERALDEGRRAGTHHVEVPSDPPIAMDDDGSALEPFKEAKRTVVDEFERAYLDRLLARAGKNVSRAAALAGIERQSLRDLLKRHGLRGDSS